MSNVENIAAASATIAILEGGGGKSRRGRSKEGAE
jgi:hypothetical protein